MRQSTIRIGITGGGTGGHVYPLLAVVDEIQKESQHSYSDASFEFHYFGPSSIFWQEFEFRNIFMHPIVSSKLRRYFAIENIIDIPKFFFSIIQAVCKLLVVMPDVLFSKGGPGALPVVLAAKFFMIPVIIHESDAVPGLTNVLSGKVANKICVAFREAAEHFPKERVTVTGNPIRPAMLSNRMSNSGAKSYWRLNPDLPVISVLGGSQGSQRMNSFITDNLDVFLPTAQVLHQTGQANYEEVQNNARTLMGPLPTDIKERYRAVAYMDMDEMKQAITAADVIISRAGSGAIFEIASFGKPSIIVPLPEAAGDHQRVNAYAYAETGAAFVIEEPNFTGNLVNSKIISILSDPNIQKNMSEKALQFFHADAAAAIAATVFEVMKR